MGDDLAILLVAVGLTLLAAGFPISTLVLMLYSGGNGIYSFARGTLPLRLFGLERLSGADGPSRHAELAGTCGHVIDRRARA